MLDEGGAFSIALLVFYLGEFFWFLVLVLVPVSGLPPTWAITFCCAKK